MPVLPNPKHEQVAQNAAKGVSNVEAYGMAGYVRNRSAAAQFFARPEVKARVEEIRAVRNRAVQDRLEKEIQTSHAIAMRLGITKEKIIQGLFYNAQRCLRGTPVLDANGIQTGKYSGKPDAAGANQAFRLLGVECFGMFVEKLEIGGPGDFSRLTDEEFEQKFKEEAEAAGLPQDAIAGLLTFDPLPDDNEK